MSGTPTSEAAPTSSLNSSPQQTSESTTPTLHAAPQSTDQQIKSPEHQPSNSSTPSQIPQTTSHAPTSRPPTAKTANRHHTPTSTNLPCKLSITVPRDAVGFIIGKRGETVRNMMDRSKAYIHVDRDDTNPNAPDRLFHIQGDQTAVATALSLIKEKVYAVLHGRSHIRVGYATPTTSQRGPIDSSSSGPPSSTGDLTSNSTNTSLEGPSQPQDACDDEDVVGEEDGPLFAPLEMWIPRGCVGMIIGHGGQVINEMQEKAGATIVVHNSRMDNTGSKLLTISGGEREKLHAKSLIESILDRAGPRPRFAENTPASTNQSTRHHPYLNQPQHTQRQNTSEIASYSSRDRSKQTASHSYQMPQASPETFAQENQSQFLQSPHHQGPAWPLMPPHGMYDPRTMAEFMNVPQAINPWPVHVQRPSGMHMPSHFAQSTASQPPQAVAGPRGTIMQGHVAFAPQTPTVPVMQGAPQPPSQPQTPTLRDTPTHTDLPSPMQPLQHPTYPSTPSQPVPTHTPQTYDSNTPSFIHANPSTPLQLPQAQAPSMVGPINQPSQFFPVPGHNVPTHAGVRPQVVHDARSFHPGTYPGSAYAHPRPFYGGALGQQPALGWPFGVPFEGNVPQPGPMFKPQTRCMKVPTYAIGSIIGRSGETIRDLQQRSGAFIHLDTSRASQSEDHERLVYIYGSEAATEIAQGLIEDVVAKGSARFAGVDRRDTKTTHIEHENEPGETRSPSGTEHESAIVDDRNKKTQVGDTNGQAYTRSRSEQQRSSKDEDKLEQEGGSGDQIVKERSSHGSENEKFEETDEIGTTVEKVREEIVTVEMSIPDAKVGMVIGKRGATIKQLQHKSEAKIAVSKEMDVSRADRPRVVRITGTRPHVEEAQRLILGRIDRPCEGNIHEGSDGIGGDVMDSERIGGFGHTGFSGPIGAPSEMAQFHAMGLPVSPMRVTQFPLHGRNVGVIPPSGMGVYVTSGFSGMGRQDVDAGMSGTADRYADTRYLGGTYATPIEGSGPSDAMSSRTDNAIPQGHTQQEEGVRNSRDTQETAKSQTPLSERLTEPPKRESEER